MPKQIPWRETAINVDAVEADRILDGLMPFDIGKSNTMACSLCLDGHHKMRYRLLVCSTEECSEASEPKCAWRGKVLSCMETNKASIYEYGAHTATAAAPKTKRLSLTQKAFCKEMADQYLRPKRIRQALSRKFGTPLDELPSLTCVQNFVNYYARTYLENHDIIDALRVWVQAKAFTGSETMTQAFTFGWQMDAEGKPVVGNGSDDMPFVVGLSTKALMLRLMAPPECFVLHVDATYKMNHCEYPVLVVGISDQSRCFHVVALFVISQETETVLEAAILSLRRLYSWITQQELVVKYAMGDADQAQYKALRTVFGGHAEYHFLMCFFHVMERVHKALRSFPSRVTAAVLQDMYDMHFARSTESFLAMRDQVVQRWMADPELVTFTQYMWGQWLTGRFSTWQVCATRCGFASTNNPCESFNALLKRDYTL